MHAMEDHNDDTNGDCKLPKRSCRVKTATCLWNCPESSTVGQSEKIKTHVSSHSCRMRSSVKFLLYQRTLPYSHTTTGAVWHRKENKEKSGGWKWRCKLLTKGEQWRRRNKKDDGDFGLLTGCIKHNQSCRFVLLEQLGQTLRQEEAFFRPTSQIHFHIIWLHLQFCS